MIILFDSKQRIYFKNILYEKSLLLSMYIFRIIEFFVLLNSACVDHESITFT